MEARRKTIIIVASREGFRRLNSGISDHNVIHCSLGDYISIQGSERPDIVIVEIHSRWSVNDTENVRSILLDVQNTSKKRPKTILYLSSPQVAHFVGALLFADDTQTKPSSLIDSLILTPPLATRHKTTLDTQVTKTISYFSTLLDSENHNLPALGEKNWAPTLCDPNSLELWFQWLPRYASYTNESPLIVGETGTGKTSLAAAIHLLSERAGPFVTVTPRDFSSPELVQAELFGAVAGAYTGAVDKWGLVKKAEGGTLFIDELQSIDIELQGKLITFIEDKKYRRVGAAEQHSADVRFVFASNKSLEELVSAGSLRDDFAYRLERLQLRILPLRQRPLDIIAGICSGLALIHRVRPKRQHIVEGLSEEALRLLFNARWPGNLRQLENVVAQSVERALANGRRIISEEDARYSLEQSLGGNIVSSEEILARALESVRQLVHEDTSLSAIDISTRLLSFAREYALESCSGDAERASALLGENTELLRWIEEAK